MKVIKIDGIKGLISAIFIGACLFAGFAISPGYAAMYLWNKYFVTLYSFPALNLFQGVLLWAILVISYCILTKGGFAVSFKNTPELSDEELDSIIKTAKINTQMRMINKLVSKSDKFDTIKQNPFEVKDIQSSVSQNDNETEDKVSNLK